MGYAILALEMIIQVESPLGFNFLANCPNHGVLKSVMPGLQALVSDLGARAWLAIPGLLVHTQQPSPAIPSPLKLGMMEQTALFCKVNALGRRDTKWRFKYIRKNSA